MVWGRRPPSRWSCNSTFGTVRRVSSVSSLVVTVGRSGGEGGQAHRDVVRALAAGRVAHPLAGRRDDGLTGSDLQATAVVVHEDGAAQHDGHLAELGRLERLR